MSRARPHELEAQRFAALSHPTRLIVFRAVMRAGPAGLPAGALADEAGVTPSNLSAHLKDLHPIGTPLKILNPPPRTTTEVAHAK